MIVVVTGMVGIDKKRYLEDVVTLARGRGKNVSLCNVGDAMYAEAPDITEGHILDIPLKRLETLRRSVIKDIISKAKSAENLIVNTHATFRWRHGLFRAFDFDQMRELGADKYICMIDGVDALHVRLTSEHPMRHSLKDLLVWREEEMLATEMMRSGTNENAEVYCLARGEGKGTVETFYRLMFEAERKKAYLSFPMTHVMDLAGVRAEIEGFRNAMKEKFTCFDPANLEEAYLPGRAKRAKEKGEKEITITSLGAEVAFGVEEIEQIGADINSQIYARDFAMIDQADMIVSFIPPLDDGRAAISSGVERELQHAYEAAKEVYVVWVAEAEPSVFVTQTATKVFKNVKEALIFFADKV